MISEKTRQKMHAILLGHIGLEQAHIDYIAGEIDYYTEMMTYDFNCAVQWLESNAPSMGLQYATVEQIINQCDPSLVQPELDL